MAYLNLRERRIEAKIAYVGAELVGKATNVARLRGTTEDARIGKVESLGEGDLLALAWRPTDADRFRDCDVRVHVVAQHGPSSEERYRDVLRDVDGVVFVVDAHPSAQERNRASLDVVREVLARGERRNVPVVLQLNKTDLSDALPAQEVLGGLDAGALQHVVASAAHGNGVVDTLEAAMNAVFDAIQAEGEVTNTVSKDTMRPGLSKRVPEGTNGTTDGGHPLLAALRQVLRDTAREQADELEARVTARLQDTLARVERRVISVEAKTAELRARVEEGAEQQEATQREIAERERTERERARAESAATAESERARRDEIDAALRGIGPLLEGLASAVGAAATKNDLSLVTMSFDRLRDELKAEILRVIESRAKTDREQLTTAATTIRKAVEGVSAEVRAVDVRARVEQLSELVKGVVASTSEVSGRVDAAAQDVRGISPRLGQVEAAWKERTAKLEASLKALESDMTEAFAATDEKVKEVHQRVSDLIEEMKKPKKGWFG